MTAVIVVVNVALAAVLPGWLALRCLGWPRSRPERLILVFPTSVSLLAIATALLGRTDRPFDLHALLVLDGALAIGALARGQIDDTERPRLVHVLLGIAPGLALLAIFVAEGGGLVTGPSTDSLVHASLVRWFGDGRPAPPLLTDHLGARLVPEIRFGWQVMAAMLVRGTTIDPGRALTLATWPVVLSLPASLMLFCRRLGMRWATVVATGVAALGFGLVPFRAAALGQSPLLCGAYVIAPCAAVATVDALRQRTAPVVALAVLLTSGLLFTHPSDLPTELLLFLALAPQLRTATRPRPRNWALLASGGVVFVLLARIEFGYGSRSLGTTALGRPTLSGVDIDHVFTARHLSGFVDTVLATLTSGQRDWILPALAIGALLLALREGAVRALAGLGIVLLLLQVDSWGWQWPAYAVRHLYPWSSTERLLYLDWFVLPPLAALGAAALVHRFIRVDAATATRAVVAISLAAAIAPLTIAPRLTAYASTELTGLTDADRAALPQVARIVPRQDLILTDDVTDGGAWIPILTDGQTLLDHDWIEDSAADSVRAALRGLCASGSGARLLALGVRWVYLGPHSIQGQRLADRSCTSGSAELESVPLTEAGANGPWLLRVRSQPTG